MSTIIASNVSDGTLSIPTTYVTNGSAKAWASLNGTGTIALRDSFNVSSVTDNSTGNYTFNFSSAMSNANYSIGTCGYSDVGVNYHCHQELWGTNISAGSYRVQMFYAALNPFDTDYVLNQVHGDLA